jgi:pimeloyl-ACP methyl ester carboxylesterase
VPVRGATRGNIAAMWSAVGSGVTLLAGLLLYGWAATQALARGLPAWLVVIGAPLAYLALLALFVAAYFALAWLFRARRPRDVQLRVADTLRLVWYEYWTLAGAPFRMLFYRALVRDPPPGPATLPVLLVHGVLCNAGVWARFVRLLRRAGEGPVYALSYGPPLASIELFAEQLARRIDEVRAATGAAQVMLVTHSMGGLVTLAYLRRYGSAHVRRVVAIGAPFQGSVHARAFFGTALSQLRPRNAWLTELSPSAPGHGPPIVSLWSWHDSMVAPQTSSLLPGAVNVALAGIGHNALLRDPQVVERVVAEYRAACGAPATSESPA